MCRAVDVGGERVGYNGKASAHSITTRELSGKRERHHMDFACRADGLGHRRGTRAWVDVGGVVGRGRGHVGRVDAAVVKSVAGSLGSFSRYHRAPGHRSLASRIH